MSLKKHKYIMQLFLPNWNMTQFRFNMECSARTKSLGEWGPNKITQLLRYFSFGELQLPDNKTSTLTTTWNGRNINPPQRPEAERISFFFSFSFFFFCFTLLQILSFYWIQMSKMSRYPHFNAINPSAWPRIRWLHSLQRGKTSS